MIDTIHLNAENVKMIAHRGLSGIELENTNSAFIAAANRSYYGIETDVHRTADGQFIIIHDDNTKRVAGDEMIVEKTTYETLRAIRLVDKDGAKGRKDLMMPSLAEYIGICKKYGKEAVLELKNHFKPEHVHQIIDVISEIGWLDHTTFISFALPNMICIRERLPEQPAQFLTSKFHDWIVETLVKYNLDLDIYFKGLTEEALAEVHADGHIVNVWTVDDPADGERLAAWGVDMITSNILE